MDLICLHILQVFQAMPAIPFFQKLVRFKIQALFSFRQEIYVWFGGIFFISDYINIPANDFYINMCIYTIMLSWLASVLQLESRMPGQVVTFYTGSFKERNITRNQYLLSQKLIVYNR